MQLVIQSARNFGFTTEAVNGGDDHIIFTATEVDCVAESLLFIDADGSAIDTHQGLSPNRATDYYFIIRNRSIGDRLANT